eukprot:71138_1
MAQKEEQSEQKVNNAQANMQPKYPKALQEILSYITDNPMSIIGQKMYYKPMNQLSTKHLHGFHDKIQALNLTSSENNKSKHHAIVCQGLLYLALDGLDHCHDLVTPFSWSSYTGFAGQPVRNSPAKQSACYAHALTHRREGQFQGEFGSGWNNSGFWIGSTGNHVLYPKVAQYCCAAISNEQNKYKKHKHILKFFQSMTKKDPPTWDPYQFVNLCEHAAESQDKKLMIFCEDIANAEWRMLFDYCYNFASSNL